MAIAIARARGICARCRQYIEVGQEIELAEGLAATHVGCVPFPLPKRDPLVRGHTDLDLTGTPPMVYRSRSCSWCGTLNVAVVARCRTCGHDAQRPRMECTCPQCRKR